MRTRSIGILFIGLLFLTSCGTFKYRSTRSIQVKGLPYTDFYLANQKSESYIDGYEKEMGALKAKTAKNVTILLGSTDSAGNAVLTLSTKEYKKGKKGIYAVKSGYEPEKFTLHQRFNTLVLLDVIYPVSFFFDKYKILSENKVNELYLSKKARYDCFDYLQMADEEVDFEKRKEYLKSAIAQDYRNENGVKTVALLNLAEIVAKEGDFHLSYLMLKKIREDDPYFDISSAMGQLQAYVNNNNQMIIEKEEKWNRALNIMGAVGNALTATGQSLGGVQSGNNYSTVSGSYASYSGSTNETSASGGNYQAIYDNWARRAEANYNSITNTGIDLKKDGKHAGAAGSYSAGNYMRQKNAYLQAQREMRNIRRKAEQNGVKITPSQWETAPIAAPIKYDGVP